MPAYLIADVTEVSDPAKFEQYVSKVVAVAQGQGGRYLAAGNGAEVLEGDWRPTPTIIEFDDVDAARSYFASDAYAEIADLRRESSSANVVIVEGL